MQVFESFGGFAMTNELKEYKKGICVSGRDWSMRERKEEELTYHSPATGICEGGKDWMMKRNEGDMPIPRHWYLWRQ